MSGIEILGTAATVLQIADLGGGLLKRDLHSPGRPRTRTRALTASTASPKRLPLQATSLAKSAASSKKMSSCVYVHQKPSRPRRTRCRNAIESLSNRTRHSKEVSRTQGHSLFLG